MLSPFQRMPRGSDVPFFFIWPCLSEVDVTYRRTYSEQALPAGLNRSRSICPDQSEVASFFHVRPVPVFAKPPRPRRSLQIVDLESYPQRRPNRRWESARRLRTR